jgi:hypothetical protein
MTITANELLQLFDKVLKLGYTYEISEDVYGGYKEDVYGGYKIVIRYWDKRKTTIELYISKYSNRYDEFNEVMEDLDSQLKAKVIDKEKEERFKQYLKLKEEFAND